MPELNLRVERAGEVVEPDMVVVNVAVNVV